MCTGNFQVDIYDADSRNNALARLKNARQQFRQASILVVLDAENLELVTFYKKADIVKDQQAILSKFGQICKQNQCKIERKNACRVIDLVKPDSSRTWRLFSEAVLASLTLQSPTGRKIRHAGSNVYLVPEVEAVFTDRAIRTKYETKYHLRKADLQIITGGYLLLAMRDSAWPPAYALTDTLDSDGSRWEKPPHGSIVYLLPTGQLARYNGGWIGIEDDVWPWESYPEDYDRNELRSRVCWFDKVREWLEDRDYHDYESRLLGEDRVWCSVEIPVFENADDNGVGRDAVSWKTVVWPTDLMFVFLDEKELTPKDEIGGLASDPLAAAQTWFSKDCSDLRAAASKDTLESEKEASLVDGILFDDDPPFGSPQQFMSNPTQLLHANQIVYPTPPEAMHPQNTPGLSLDGTAQTPISTHPTQASVYQSSPLATTADTDMSHPHNSAISNFLQHNDDDDLFEDEEEQKLAQPSFGDEPNWDFFDRDTTALDMKPGLGFDDLNESPMMVKSPDIEMESRPRPSSIQSGKADTTTRSPTNNDSVTMTSTHQSLEHSHNEATAGNTAGSIGPSHLVEAFPPKVKDFAKIEMSASPASAKRRRSSAYDVNTQPQKGHDHKYALSGKYHFELRRSSTTTQDKGLAGKSGQHSASTSVSSQSSQSEGSSNNNGEYDENSKSWTRYEPDLESDAPETVWDEQQDGSIYMADVDALLEVIASAPGTEPFVCLPPPQGKDTEGKSKSLRTSERSFMIAQILTEQMTQSNAFVHDEILQLPRTKAPPAFDVFVENSEFGTNIGNASIGDLATIQSANNNSKTATHTVPLETDRVCLKQADGDISAELPIIKYWETVNLQPLSGPKNVHALCLHPSGTNYVQGCDSFMRRMKETYTSCNLGTHERLELKPLTDTGLLAWGSTSGKTSLSSVCRNVGKTLASRNTKGCTIIYVIMPGEKLLHSIEICDAFLELFEALGHIDHSPENDIVLQLVPNSFVVDPDNLVVQPQKRYVNLALEVYNRTPGASARSASDTASAVMIEKSIGRALHFELNSKTSSPSLRSGHCCHLAYCTSSDRRWLVASWSDTTGQIALTMPYRLTDNDDGSHRPRIDVFKHMCETSVHLMGRQKGQSWLAVAKVGIYETEELQDWLHLTQRLNDEHKSISRIVILNVELQSRLSLHGSQMPLKQTNPSSQVGMHNLSTPATTPQAVTTSPEQAMSVTPTTSAVANPATPPDLNTDPGAEADTHLSNPMNEAWAITLGFGLNQTHNFLEIRPAMASGLLLKRVSRSDNAGGLAMINVNLIAVPRKNSTAVAFAEREQILQDVLVQYRGLHVLAVVRGCVDDADNCVPCHVASAFKGAKVLERLL